MTMILQPRLVLPDSGEDEEKQLRDQMAAQVARRDEAMEQRQRLCTQMVSVRTALYSLVIVLNQVKPTQATVKSLPKKFDWDAEQDFVDSLYAVRRGPAGAPEANGASPAGRRAVQKIASRECGLRLRPWPHFLTL